LAKEDEKKVEKEEQPMLGLKRGTVQLYEHEQAWEIEAQNTILRLKEILGGII